MFISTDAARLWYDETTGVFKLAVWVRNVGGGPGLNVRFRLTESRGYTSESPALSAVPVDPTRAVSHLFNDITTWPVLDTDDIEVVISVLCDDVAGRLHETVLFLVVRGKTQGAAILKHDTRGEEIGPPRVEIRDPLPQSTARSQRR